MGGSTAQRRSVVDPSPLDGRRRFAEHGDLTRAGDAAEARVLAEELRGRSDPSSLNRAGADLVLHGHAHGGTEKGQTDGGVPVRNVAQSVIRRAYALYTLEPERARAKEAAAH